MRCPSCKKEYFREVDKICPHCGVTLGNDYRSTRGEHKTWSGEAIKREKDESDEEGRK